jgi:hypothetical protein
VVLRGRYNFVREAYLQLTMREGSTEQVDVRDLDQNRDVIHRNALAICKEASGGDSTGTGLPAS